MTYVWQFQNHGVRYICEVAYFQLFVPDAYSWERKIQTRHKNNWLYFNSRGTEFFFEDLQIHGR